VMVGQDLGDGQSQRGLLGHHRNHRHPKSLVKRPPKQPSECF
jgi:hypothetical protein